MTRTLRLTVLALCIALVPAFGATAADQTGSVAPGETYTWTGAAAVGANQNYFATVPEEVLASGQCTKDPQYYCETILVRFDNPLSDADIAAGKTFLRRNANLTVTEYTVPDPLTDYDVIVRTSDAEGTRGAEVAQAASGRTTGQESTSWQVRTTPAQPSQYYLLDVVYFLSAGSSYKGTVSF